MNIEKKAGLNTNPWGIPLKSNSIVRNKSILSRKLEHSILEKATNKQTKKGQTLGKLQPWPSLTLTLTLT